MQPWILVALSLLLAHLLGDFPFQTNSIARRKGTHILAALAHGIIHYATAWFCLIVFAGIRFASLRNQLFMVAYLAFHLGIDAAKSWFIEENKAADNWALFVADQLVHIATILAFAAVLTTTGISRIVALLHISEPAKFRLLLAVTVYVAVVFGGGYLIRYLTRGLSQGITMESASQLKNAGLYIGWLERFLVITAVTIQSPAMVGLILTSKSIARFPELKDVGFAEYFLIGSLLSFGLALVGGMILVRSFYGTFSLR